MASRPHLTPSPAPGPTDDPVTSNRTTGTRTRRSPDRRSGGLLAPVRSALVVAAALLVASGVPAASAEGAVSGEACEPGEGVTVVVDFGSLPGGVVVGCAPGAQANGFAALAAAGFTVGFDGGPGMVCTIDGRPVEGYPFCWSTGGYWSYWKKDRGGAWDFSRTGGGSGPVAVDAVEGWSWAADFSSVPPSADETSAPPVTTTTTTTTTTTPEVTATVPGSTTTVPGSTTTGPAGPTTTVPDVPTTTAAVPPTTSGGPRPGTVPAGAAPASSPRRPLARTGAAPLPLILTGGLLVAVGLTLTVRPRALRSDRA